jgi:hypothetical protein
MVRSFCQRISVATGTDTERAPNQAISISPDHPDLPGAWLLALGVLNPAEILLPISGLRLSNRPQSFLLDAELAEMMIHVSVAPYEPI